MRMILAACFCLVFLATGSVFATPPAGLSLEQHRAYQTLAESERYRVSRAGGQVPKELGALHTLARSPSAMAIFERLTSEGSLSGRLYGLRGLQMIAPERAAHFAKPLAAMNTQVKTKPGRTARVDRLVKRILEGA